jgi:hypothetical protein
MLRSGGKMATCNTIPALPSLSIYGYLGMHLVLVYVQQVGSPPVKRFIACHHILRAVGRDVPPPPPPPPLSLSLSRLSWDLS